MLQVRLHMSLMHSSSPRQRPLKPGSDGHRKLKRRTRRMIILTLTLMCSGANVYFSVVSFEEQNGKDPRTLDLSGPAELKHASALG